MPRSLLKPAAAASLAVAMLIGPLGLSGSAEAKGKGKRVASADPEAAGTLNYGMAGCGGLTTWVSADTTGSQLGLTSMRSTIPFGIVLGGAVMVTSGLVQGNSLLYVAGALIVTGGQILSYSFMPSFGMSFGTSNCKPNNAHQVAMIERQVYVSVNLMPLSKEAAQGSGEHVEALSTLYGCKQPVAKAVFAQMLKKHYEKIFDLPDGEAVATQVTAQANEDHDVTSACDPL